MKEVFIKHIADAIERMAPLTLQESWDNSGLQVGSTTLWVKGVLTCVDVTPEVVREAINVGANLIVSHHPLLFRGLKSITGTTRTQKAVELAIKNDIAVYSAHTSLDNAEFNVSMLLARKLGYKILRPLVPTFPGATTGTGVICDGDSETPAEFFIEHLKKIFPALRHSDVALAPKDMRFIAICGGSGAEFIPDAIGNNCSMYITGDLKHHDFVDYADRILLVDCGHFETEMPSREWLADVIHQAYPELPVYISEKENNPVFYQ